MFPMLPRWLVLSVALALFALTPLAYTSPPDQTWIAGLYDNADYDDVILLITSSVSVVQSDPLRSVGPSTTAVGVVISATTSSIYSAPHHHSHPRAPPLA